MRVSDAHPLLNSASDEDGDPDKNDTDDRVFFASFALLLLMMMMMRRRTKMMVIVVLMVVLVMTMMMVATMMLVMMAVLTILLKMVLLLKMKMKMKMMMMMMMAVVLVLVEVVMMTSLEPMCGVLCTSDSRHRASRTYGRLQLQLQRDARFPRTPERERKSLEASNRRVLSLKPPIDSTRLP